MPFPILSPFFHCPELFSFLVEVRCTGPHIAAFAGSCPVGIVVHPASVQDRDSIPRSLGRSPFNNPGSTMIWAEGGYAGLKLEKALKELDISADLEIVRKVKESKDFDVLPRRWVV
ncbi:MAG: hypothetical protein OXC82_09210 [Rhodobacteraceae bacterium]|nr:hypothetical protein [Paracoccaceae bacterium]